MSELKEVIAELEVRINIECPHCDEYIDLLYSKQTSNYDHNDDGYLLKQIWPKHGSHDDFECEDVTCSACGESFNVKGLSW